jgi:hypothetical protein
VAVEDEVAHGQELIVIEHEDEFVDALPELARLAAVAVVRGTAWGMSVGLRAGARVARAAVDPQTAAELVQGAGEGVRAYAREFLGIVELEEQVDGLKPARTGEVPLRARGAELLRQSADVSIEEAVHPAFIRILGELAPDEARILRLLAEEGPQPAVDVRATNLIGAGSQLVCPNLTMVDRQAGVRYPERLSAYLGNLQRLGLVTFSDDPLGDAIAYQVLEAQPDVLDAIRRTTRAKSVQRSLRLTPFGEEFCAASLPRD